MRTMTYLFSSILLIGASMSPSAAEAIDVYIHRYKATLYYVDVNGKSTRMGAARGSVRAHVSGSKISFPRVTLGNDVLDADLTGFSFRKIPGGRGWHSYVNFNLGPEAIAHAMEITNGAWYAGRSKIRRVKELAQKLLHAEVLKLKSVGGSYSRYYGFPDDASTRTTLSFQSPETGEILRLKFSFRKRMSIR